MRGVVAENAVTNRFSLHNNAPAQLQSEACSFQSAVPPAATSGAARKDLVGVSIRGLFYDKIQIGPQMTTVATYRLVGAR
jgi:hypothetical protein